MVVMQGSGVSKGVAKGPVYFYQRAAAAAVRLDAACFEEEKRRLDAACEKSVEQLNALAEKARKEAGRTPPCFLRPTPCLWRTRTLQTA